MENVKRLGRAERLRELGMERAAPWQREDVAERARTRSARAGDGGGRAAATAHSLTLRRRADGADIGQMRVALVLLVPVLLFSGWRFLRREQNEDRLALVASEIALRDVEVSCPGFWTRLVEVTPNAGWVNFDEHGRPNDETSLSAAMCRTLERVWRGKERTFGCLLAGGCDRETLGAVSGIVTLAHESWHLRGLVNEALTQCYAVQTTSAVARALGVPAVEAELVAARVALDDARAQRGEYHSPACRPGGDYDLRPETRDWPSR